MTFYEAAVEVLRRSGRPLHFKKITEVAIRDELLSHIGKTPESTMEDRLDQESKKEDTSWIVRTRPGVYMLRSDIADQLNEEAKTKDEENRRKREEERARQAEQREQEDAEDADDEEEFDDEEGEEGEDEDEDEDQDEDEDEDESEDEDEEDGGDDAKGGGRSASESADNEDDGGGRGRRRRRRRGRGRSQSSDEAPAGDAEEPTADQPKRNGQAREDKGERRRGRGRSRGKGKQKEGKDSSSFEDLQGERFDSITKAAFAVLQANERKPLNAAKIANAVFDNKLIKFHTHDPEATIQSAIVTDNQVRGRSGRRPLFSQYRDGRWGLTEWGVSDEGIEKEQKILALAAELRKEAHEQLGEAFSRLKAEAFEMVVMTLLERLDYRNLKVSKRTSEGDTYFSADWRRGFSDLRVCVHVASNAEATLGADAVKELRDTLEHYSAAEGIIVHIGQIAKDAVHESRKEDEAKVTIIDRKTFVRLLIDEGIGVRTFQTPLVMVDTAFIDALVR